MTYLTVQEVLRLHSQVAKQSGGGTGVRDMGLIESAVGQPQATFGGQELYPTIAEKAATLCFSLVCNHPFVDGNKRIGHAAMEVFLLLNGHELSAPIDESEQIILALASGTLSRSELTDWVKSHLRKVTLD